MPEGLFQPKAPNLLGLAGTIEQIRAGRERRGLQREALGFQQEQFRAQQQQKREQAIVEQKQKQFDQAATLFKNAPTDEIAIRAANIMGDTLGIKIDSDKIIQNRKQAQQGMGNILSLSASGKKQDALNLSIALLNEFSQTPAATEIRGLQTGLMKDIGAIRERERRGGIFAGEPEPEPFIPGQMEDGVSILEPTGLVEGVLPTGLPSLEEPIASTGISKIEQQIKTSFGEPALKALQAGDVALFEKLKIAPKAPVIRDVNIGGGKVQTQGIDPTTGGKLFTVSAPFPRFKPTGARPFEKDVEIWARIKEGDPPQLQFKKVKIIDGEVGAATLKTLEKGGFQPESIAKTNLSAQLRIPADDFSSIINRLTGRTEETGQPTVPRVPKGALTFDQFFAREKRRDSTLNKIDAMTEYIRQIEAAR